MKPIHPIVTALALVGVIAAISSIVCHSIYDRGSIPPMHKLDDMRATPEDNDGVGAGSA